MISRPDATGIYMWNDRCIEFHHCRTCGCTTHYQGLGENPRRLLRVAEAVRLGTTSSDPQVRSDIWRHAHANHTHALLLLPLLYALTSDPDRRVREEAAETLDLYLDQPGVREALQAVSQSDAELNVRRQAEMSLAGPEGGF